MGWCWALPKRLALAMSAISTLAEAHLFGRDVGVADEVGGLLLLNGHAIALQEVRESAQ